MAAPQQPATSSLRLLEEALGMGLTSSGDSADAEAAEGAYYLEQVTITETSEDDYEYEEIPDDNFSIPEGEEDLARAVQIVQEQTTDTQILPSAFGRKFKWMDSLPYTAMENFSLKMHYLSAATILPTKEFPGTFND